MPTDSLRIFWGNFMLNGFSPIELDGNRCDFNCGYCFANLQAPQRQINATQVFKLLGELWHQTKSGKFKRDTLVAKLLRERYPVTLSNHVDFLSNSNWDITKQVMPLLNSYEIPVCVFTKWGKNERRHDEFLGMLERPTGIYTSISSLDEQLIAKLEPNAGSPQQRLDAIKKATDQGHVCTVGLNPLRPEWMGDPRPLLEACVEAGVKGVLVHALYFSSKKLKNMPAGTKKRIGDDAIEAGLATRRAGADESYPVEVARIARDEFGLEVFKSNQGQPTDYWRLWYDLYPNRYPMMQDFVNACYENLQPGDYITSDVFHDFFVDQLPEGEYGLRDHFSASAVPAVLNGKWIPQRMTYSELLMHAWKHIEIAVNPCNTMCFQYAADRIGDNDWRLVLDEDGDPVVIFNPEGQNDAIPYTDNHAL